MTTDHHRLISQYFDIRSLGVSICDGVQPPKEALDALLLPLAGDMDSLRWQTAAACNLYERYYRKRAYELMATRFGIEPETIEKWCYIERNAVFANGDVMWKAK